MSISIHQLSVGKPEPIQDYNGKYFTSSMRRKPVAHSVQLTLTGITGDKVGASFHGGPNRALHLFPFEHYEFFNAKAGETLNIPTFGENLTTVGALETDVRIGDQLALGSAIIEVSQPTERCKNIGRSAGYRDMLSWIHQHMYTGWYVRVLQEGVFSPDDRIELIEKGPDWLLLDDLNQALFKTPNPELVEAALKSDLPANEWKERAVKLASRLTT